MSGDLGLPPLFHARDFPGSLNEYVEWLHWQYRAMRSGVTLWGKPVVGSDKPTPDGRGRLFWHLITDSVPGSDRRVLSLSRCAHLGRVWWLLERLAEGDPRAVWWRAENRFNVAPCDFSFRVGMVERKSVFVLCTAHATCDTNARTTARRVWAEAILAQVPDSELYARAQSLAVPRPPRRRTVVERVPAALERVLSYVE